jgi:PadR family transcriptional regulator, regulatory protein PadR
MATDLTYIGALVLHAIRSGHRYGFQIMAATELPSGTVYPVLRRLEKAELIRSQWEKVAVARAEQRPTRKYYRVTTDGESALTEAGMRYRFPEIEAAPKEAHQ